MSNTKGRGPVRAKTAAATAEQIAPAAPKVAPTPAPISAEAAPAPVIQDTQKQETPMAIDATVTKIAADTAAQAKTVIDQTTTQTKAAMEKTMEQATKAAEGMMKAAEEAAEFGRGNIEALTKAAQLWATGTQDLAKQYAAVAQGFADHAMESAKALSSVKSLKEAADLQTSFAKAAFEKSSAETTKFQEAVLRLTESAAAPITARVQLAMEKFSKPLAA